MWCGVILQGIKFPEIVWRGLHHAIQENTKKKEDVRVRPQIQPLGLSDLALHYNGDTIHKKQDVVPRSTSHIRIIKNSFCHISFAPFELGQRDRRNIVVLVEEEGASYGYFTAAPDLQCSVQVERAQVVVAVKEVPGQTKQLYKKHIYIHTVQ